MEALATLYIGMFVIVLAFAIWIKTPKGKRWMNE